MGDLDLAGLNEHERRNRAGWNAQAADYAEAGERRWASDTVSWGMWDVQESEVGILPDVAGHDVVELGCGTAYWSAWLARRGARPVGVDLSEAQLETARKLQARHGLGFPLLHASAERVPLPDASFDLAFSEYGAAIWCDPYAWIPEAHRLLRLGGRLIFLGNSVQAMLCAPPSEDPVGETLQRPQFGGLYRMEWPDEEGVNFCLPHGEMLARLRLRGRGPARAALRGGPGRRGALLRLTRVGATLAVRGRLGGPQTMTIQSRDDRHPPHRISHHLLQRLRWLLHRHVNNRDGRDAPTTEVLSHRAITGGVCSPCPDGVVTVSAGRRCQQVVGCRRLAWPLEPA